MKGVQCETGALENDLALFREFSEYFTKDASLQLLAKSWKMYRYFLSVDW